jgi:hypothetical protein
LSKTEQSWPQIRIGYGWVYQAQHLLTNKEGLCVEELRRAYRQLLAQMLALAHQHKEEAVGASGVSSWLGDAVMQFMKVTKSYWRGLFRCYEYASVGIPRTNNDLEQYFGSVRYRERRATGRKGASPGLVVRGNVRVVAAVATPVEGLQADDIRPADPVEWVALRRSLDTRQEGRRAQLRFRKDPGVYLANLEGQLLKLILPS